MTTARREQSTNPTAIQAPDDRDIAVRQDSKTKLWEAARVNPGNAAGDSFIAKDLRSRDEAHAAVEHERYWVPTTDRRQGERSGQYGTTRTFTLEMAPDDLWDEDGRMKP